MDVQKAYELLYSSVLTGIALLLFIMLFRSVRGPSVTDKLLSINMVGTLGPLTDRKSMINSNSAIPVKIGRASCRERV